MSVCVKLCVLLALVSLLHSGSAAPEEKLASCCTTVSTKKILEPITGFLPQKKSGHCVHAFIFQTEKNLYCIYPRAPWVPAVLKELKRKQASAKARSTVLPSAPSKVSLLSVITSTAQTSTAQTSTSSAQTSTFPTAQTSTSTAQTSTSTAQTSTSTAQTSTSTAQTSTSTAQTSTSTSTAQTSTSSAQTSTPSSVSSTSPTSSSSSFAENAF